MDAVQDVTLYQEAEKYIPKGYDPELYKIRHSAAHVLAQAVKERFDAGGRGTRRHRPADRRWFLLRF